ncbi:MAG: hypothetical protein R3E61_08605 [Pseudomonadales bacterium]
MSVGVCSWRIGMCVTSNALCWILMPETLKGLFRQRTRWAQGGAGVVALFT